MIRTPRDRRGRTATSDVSATYSSPSPVVALGLSGIRRDCTVRRWFTMLTSQISKGGGQKQMQKVIVGLGELLWDLLPSGKRLGGAPANFTVMSSRLGNRGVIASRLGNDPLAAEARESSEGLPRRHLPAADRSRPLRPAQSALKSAATNRTTSFTSPLHGISWSGHRNGARSRSPPMPSASVRSPSATPPPARPSATSCQQRAPIASASST